MPNIPASEMSEPKHRLEALIGGIGCWVCVILFLYSD